MSTPEQIRAEYERDINAKTRLVVARRGIGALLEGGSGMHVESLFGKPRGDGSMVLDLRTSSSKERD